MREFYVKDTPTFCLFYDHVRSVNIGLSSTQVRARKNMNMQIKL